MDETKIVAATLAAGLLAQDVRSEETRRNAAANRAPGASAKAQRARIATAVALYREVLTHLGESPADTDQPARPSE